MNQAVRSANLPPELLSQPALDVVLVEDGSSRSTSRVSMMTHFAHSTRCPVVLNLSGEEPDHLVLTGAELADYYKPATLTPDTRCYGCSQCFNGTGFTEILRYGRSKKANVALRLLTTVLEANALANKLDHARQGVVARHLYGRREAPGALANATKFVATRLDTLVAQDAAQIAPALEAFHESHQRLAALVDPSASADKLLDRLADFIMPGQNKRRLDHTPTLLAINSTRPWIANWYNYAAELSSAMRVSPSDARGMALYGPRFAIDYFLRSTNLSPSEYAVSVPGVSIEVAKIAAGLWDPTSKGPMSDIFEAVDTAATMAHAPNQAAATPAN
jgi:hypothetical protein